MFCVLTVILHGKRNFLKSVYTQSYQLYIIFIHDWYCYFLFSIKLFSSCSTFDMNFSQFWWIILKTRAFLMNFCMHIKIVGSNSIPFRICTSFTFCSKIRRTTRKPRTTTEDIPEFDRTKVSLDVPPQLIGGGFDIITALTKVIGSLIMV